MGRDNAPQHAQTPQHPLQTKCRSSSSSPLPYGDQKFCSRTLPRRVPSPPPVPHLKRLIICSNTASPYRLPALASMRTLSPRPTERDPLLSVRLNLTCFPLWGRQVAAPAVNARTRETIHALAVSNAPQANIDVGAAASSARKAGSRRGDRPW